eukprot:scaffold3870_cov246-Pinguiococcus_pyrenoidosus.AAC.17
MHYLGQPTLRTDVSAALLRTSFILCLSYWESRAPWGISRTEKVKKIVAEGRVRGIAERPGGRRGQENAGALGVLHVHAMLVRGRRVQREGVIGRLVRSPHVAEGRATRRTEACSRRAEEGVPALRRAFLAFPQARTVALSHARREAVPRAGRVALSHAGRMAFSHARRMAFPSAPSRCPMRRAHGAAVALHGVRRQPQGLR